MFSQAFERVIRGELTPTELRRELALSSATFYRYRQVCFLRGLRQKETENV